MERKTKVLTVSQLNRFIKGMLESDDILSDACVQGEISNFKRHTSGHFYFTLKDESAAVNCVMFRSAAQQILFSMENGMKVIIFGHISLYEKTGVYQLYAEYAEPAGKGAQALKFEQLKKKLEAEGLFDSARKKPIPSYPGCIAVITSKTGAAIRDVIQIAKRRNPNVQLVIAPALVQGSEAPKEIINAIRMVNAWGKADAIILGRGGGSQEDLSPFNDEALAYAIASSAIPIIAAIGHETDFTIADFASDQRAPTPSAAAELAIPSLKVMTQSLQSCMIRINNSLRRRYAENKKLLNSLRTRPVLRRPLEDVYNKQEYASTLAARLQKEAIRLLEAKKLKFQNLNSLLGSLSPESILCRGYAIVAREDGKLVTRSESLLPDQEVSLKFIDGTARARITCDPPAAVDGSPLSSAERPYGEC
jgi:exodeoxyribonuclease VII large subunit